MNQISALLMLLCFLTGLSQTRMLPVLNDLAQKGQPLGQLLK